MTSGLRRLLIPGVTTLIMLGVLIGLGTWQVNRLLWKTRILNDIALAETQPARPLTGAPDPFTKVQVTGRPRPGPTALFGAEVRTTPTGPTLGARLIVVLDRPGDAPVLVDRGWVSTGRPPPPTPDSLTLEAFVHPGNAASLFSAADDLVNRRFYTLDPRVIAIALGVPDAAPFVLVALGPHGVPDPARHLPRPPNNHLIYAATWYGFAVTLAIIFILWARKGHPT